MLVGEVLRLVQEAHLKLLFLQWSQQTPGAPAVRRETSGQVTKDRAGSPVAKAARSRPLITQKNTGPIRLGAARGLVEDLLSGAYGSI
ncbi:hypothetical protein Ato02nite_027560 [Paractinoplanes toevensis]|uniref:Uncharacterized protein n=1 Tax=Paractinoplanes toevensis TaxID=571911 RepID=A0A919W577_9ACTN|nr:hypothetical protein Ato02nite_027560 [Actinoplanes toevensis]